jgi:hypothetical protein
MNFGNSGKFIFCTNCKQSVLFIFLVLVFFADISVCEGKRVKNAQGIGNQAQVDADSELYQLIETDFPRWDANHDGTLSAEEINTLIENPEVKGDEAVAVVLIRKNFSKDGDKNISGGLTYAQLLALADERASQREFFRNKNQIATVSHALFLYGDPNLFTFHQGRVGDCYLLAVIGGFISREPQSVRTMIRSLPGNAFEVDFASGQKIVVPNATDAELLQGSKTGNDHGVWLSILEKAYANIRETKRKNEDARPVAPDDDVPRDYLGGGRPGPAIEQFTGHEAAHTPLADSAKDDLPATEKRIHALLIQLTHDRRLIAVGTSGKTQLPPKIPHGHVFGVLGYDPNRGIVRVFNPWGDEVMPVGAPGLANGYVTRHGIFDVPLQEFIQIFKTLTYETDQPLNK